MAAKKASTEALGTVKLREGHLTKVFINLDNLTLESITHPVPIGIALGLFVGKQLGVFGFAWLAIKTGIASKAKDFSWLSLYGVAILCGVGFTMSLFIGTLAFKPGDLPAHIDERFGILLGSLLSAVGGYFLLRYSLKRNNTTDTENI